MSEVNENGIRGVYLRTEDYVELLEDQRFLRCLEHAGVDNWEGFDIAREIYDQEYGKGE